MNTDENNCVQMKSEESKCPRNPIQSNTIQSESESEYMPGAETPDSSNFISLPLNDKTEFFVTESMIAKWAELYPAVDVKQDLRKMRGWLDSNPSRRKTKSGIKRFITNWLAKSQDSGGSKKPENSMPDYNYGTKGVDYL